MVWNDGQAVCSIRLTSAHLVDALDDFRERPRHGTRTQVKPRPRLILGLPVEQDARQAVSKRKADVLRKESGSEGSHPDLEQAGTHDEDTEEGSPYPRADLC